MAFARRASRVQARRSRSHPPPVGFTSLRAALAAAVCVAALVGAAGCKRKPAAEDEAAPTEEQTAPPPAEGPAAVLEGQPPPVPPGKKPRPARPRVAAEVKKIDLRLGSGTLALPGRTVTIQYVAMLPNGTKIDSTYDKPKPFSFQLGSGRVIRGWDQGIAGMKVGGKRRLEVPPELAYGAAGLPPMIPPNTALVYEIELVDVD